MGTGKTAVGRLLAERLKVPFFDADTVLAKRAGKSIAQIFEEEGEPAFRELERQVIAELTQKTRIVMATGGGSLMDARNRALLESSGILICLTARAGTLLERLKDDMTRPLLAGEDLPTRLERLMKERETVYALCPLQVATDDRTIAQVADEIIRKIGPRWQNG